MMGINDELTSIRQSGEAKRPPEINERIQRATDELRASGILDGVPGPGDRAPLFARPNLSGETVRLSARLKRGPVLLSFFRGRW
ncbi:MAG: hypothetical protein OEU54_02510 [Gemmatimonadota bacterium]|nr:hypothetical protein [Gemmatimonadota bacterium]